MKNKARFFKDLLWAAAIFGLTAGAFRLIFGLGATTNLNDQVPWGIWKIVNMIAGVALSTCGFTLGFLVYVLKIEKFKPLVRPAILIAFLGYGSSCVALLFDIGLPQYFWKPIFMWNEHSFLFEVFWCVLLYFTVTFIEFIPNILEKYKAEKIVNFLHKIALGVVIFGISLSSLHHSSLGSLFLTTPQRLHELWFSEMIPFHFIISAMGGGIFFLIFVKIIYARIYEPETVFGAHYGAADRMACVIDTKRKVKSQKVYGKDMPMLESLSLIGAGFLGVYLLFKLYDIFFAGKLQALLAGTWESWLFGFELIVSTVVPITLVLLDRARKSPFWLATAAGFAAFGLVLNRTDVGIFGYFRDAGEIYLPSLAEWSLSLGVVAASTLVFIYVVENYTIFSAKRKTLEVEQGMFKTAFDSISRVWKSALQNGLYRMSLLGVFAFPIAFVLMYPPYSDAPSEKVEPAKGIDAERTILLIDGNASKERAEFPHKDHIDRLGEEAACSQCHHMDMPNDNSTPCYRCHSNMYSQTKIFNHDYHTEKTAEKENLGGLHPENKSCYYCHEGGGVKTAQNAKNCVECHLADMKLDDDENPPKVFAYAPGYMDAMHKNCIPCHTKNLAESDNKRLDQCSTCHKNIPARQSRTHVAINKK